MSIATNWGTINKKRKPAECRYCGETINAGESCYFASGLHDGQPLTIYMHHECEPMTKDWDTCDWECISPGDFERPSPNPLHDIK